MLTLLIGGIYDVRSSDGLKCHDLHTIFYDDRFRHSTNIKVITSNWRGCSVGITDGNYLQISPLDGFMWRDTHTRFHKDWYRRSSNIKVWLQQSDML
jgi:hypothetical protein